MHHTIAAAAVFFASAIATDYGNGYGGGGTGGGMSSWSDWSSSTVAVASATVPAPVLAPTQPGELIVQIVSVADANGSLKYFPDSIQAAPGTVVQFQFHPKNHTITESSFAEPCKPLASNLTSSTRPGAKSGFVPVTGTESTTPVYNMLINDTKPIWLYCGQVNHCQKGMSMVINQNLSSTDKTIENYRLNAMNLPQVSVPPPASSVAATSVASAAPPPAQTFSPSFAPPSLSTTTAALPPPTSPAVSTTAGVSPATFTGAASQRDLMGSPALAGLLFGGLLAFW